MSVTCICRHAPLDDILTDAGFSNQINIPSRHTNSSNIKKPRAVRSKKAIAYFEDGPRFAPP